MKLPTIAIDVTDQMVAEVMPAYIKVRTLAALIHDKTQMAVSARALHKELGLSIAYTTWIEGVISSHDLVEGVDYTRSISSVSANGTKIIDHALEKLCAHRVVSKSKTQKARDYMEYEIALMFAIKPEQHKQFISQILSQIENPNGEQA